ncbi:MAG: T9SS type A sorting domain-containing protein [Bacteroidia bacterium]|nr:T9SS type A sorting domain-containing protein [Bacteroidia bacterium]
MRTFIILCCCIVVAGKSQLASADFNSGLPAGWGMSPAGSWSVHPFFGAGMSKCLYTEEMNTTSTTVSFFSTSLDLTGINTLTISFKAACTKNNFLIPNVAVSYSVGGSGKQLIARWGSGFTSPTTYTLDDVADYVPPLDTANIKWVSCTHTLAAPSGTAVSFYFDAEMINAGYVLLDDIMITGASVTSTGLNENSTESPIIVFPNPAKQNKVTLEGKNLSDILIVNSLGQSVPFIIKHESDKISIEFQNCESGIYFLHFISGGNKRVKSLMLE